MFRTTLTIAMILFGLGTIGVKAVAVAPPPAHADTLLDKLAFSLQSNGMIETGRVSLTSDGTYRAARYATLSCREAMIVMPLLRNGEFKGLLDAPRFPIQYVVAGKIYQALPTARLWKETLLTRIGWSDQEIPPVAVVADPVCIPDVAAFLH